MSIGLLRSELACLGDFICHRRFCTSENPDGCSVCSFHYATSKFGSTTVALRLVDGYPFALPEPTVAVERRARDAHTLEVLALRILEEIEGDNLLFAFFSRFQDELREMDTAYQARKHEDSLLQLYTRDFSILTQIYSHLDFQSLCCVSRVCRILNQVPWPSINLAQVTDDPDVIPHTLTRREMKYLLGKRPRSFQVSGSACHSPISSVGFQLLFGAPTLEKIDLDCVRCVPSFACMPIVDAMRGQAKLKALHLKACFLVAPLLTCMVGNALDRLMQLHSLKLDHITLPRAVWMPLFQAFGSADRSCTITHLSFNNTRFENDTDMSISLPCGLEDISFSSASQGVVKAVLDALSSIHTLRHLSALWIESHDDGDDDIDDMLALSHIHGPMETLKLGGAWMLYLEEAEQLYSVLSCNTLTTVMLKGLTVSPEVILSVFAALLQGSCIRHLSLAHTCKLQYSHHIEMMAALRSFLSKTETLEVIDLEYADWINIKQLSKFIKHSRITVIYEE